MVTRPCVEGALRDSGVAGAGPRAPAAASAAQHTGSEDEAEESFELVEAEVVGPSTTTTASVEVQVQQDQNPAAAEKPAGMQRHAAIGVPVAPAAAAAAADMEPAAATAAGAAAPAQQHGSLQPSQPLNAVVKDVQTAALAYTNKVLSAALNGLGKAEAQSRERLSRLAGELVHWWSSLDPLGDDGGAEGAHASASKLLGLLPEEHAAAFKCKLQQHYSCSHNTLTPSIQMSFCGTLYVTERHSCFLLEERSRQQAAPLKIAHSEVANVVRQKQRRGDLSDVLRLMLAPSLEGTQPSFLAFKDFDSCKHLENAHTLIQRFVDEGLVHL